MVAVACSVMLPAATGIQPAGASHTFDVTTVSGSAHGYFSSVSLFGGAPGTRGPAPAVTLPPGGSAAPVTATAPTGLAQYGPAIFFSSGALTVSTQGTTGPGGSVTSSTTITNVNTSGREAFTAGNVASSCTGSGAGVSGSTTIANGTLRTSEGDPNVEGDETVVVIPANPGPNTTYEGRLESAGDSFRYVFNEQIENADGSTTVNAAHQYLLGPTAAGDLIIGRSACGATGTPIAHDPASSAPPPPPPPLPPPPAASSGCGKSTSKLSLARATFDSSARTISILAPITRLASGNVQVTLRAAGRTTRFDAPIDTRNGRVRVTRRITASQARLGSGIITISYGGDADTRAQIVRLRAANTPAGLRISRPQITQSGFLRAGGKVSAKARGVVRVQLEYVNRADGLTVTLERSARITDGRWSINSKLSPSLRSQVAQRCGTVHSYTSFTGYLPLRMRGELHALQVLPAP